MLKVQKAEGPRIEEMWADEGPAWDLVKEDPSLVEKKKSILR